MNSPVWLDAPCLLTAQDAKAPKGRGGPVTSFSGLPYRGLLLPVFLDRRQRLGLNARARKWGQGTSRARSLCASKALLWLTAQSLVSGKRRRRACLTVCGDGHLVRFFALAPVPVWPFGSSGLAKPAAALGLSGIECVGRPTGCFSGAGRIVFFKDGFVACFADCVVARGAAGSGASVGSGMLAIQMPYPAPPYAT